MANEVAMLKQENQELKDSMRQLEKEKNEKQSKIDTFAEKYSALQDEKNKVVDTLKGWYPMKLLIDWIVQNMNNSQMSARDWAKKIWTLSVFLRIMNCY